MNACFHKVLSRKGSWSQDWGAQHKEVMNSWLSVALHGLSSRLTGEKPQWESLGHTGLVLVWAGKKSVDPYPLRTPFEWQQWVASGYHIAQKWSSLGSGSMSLFIPPDANCERLNEFISIHFAWEDRDKPYTFSSSNCFQIALEVVHAGKIFLFSNY